MRVNRLWSMSFLDIMYILSVFTDIEVLTYSYNTESYVQ